MGVSAILFSETTDGNTVTAAILAIGPPEIWQECPVFVLAIMTDSTSAELVALTGAQHVRMPVSSLTHLHRLYIHSDCKAAILRPLPQYAHLLHASDSKVQRMSLRTALSTVEHARLNGFEVTLSAGILTPRPGAIVTGAYI